MEANDETDTKNDQQIDKQDENLHKHQSQQAEVHQKQKVQEEQKFEQNEFVSKETEEKEQETVQKNQHIKESSININVDHEKQIDISRDSEVKKSSEKSPKKAKVNQSLNTIEEDQMSLLYSRNQSGKINKMKEKIRESQAKPKKKKQLFGAKTNEQVQQEVRKWKSQQKEIRKKRQLEQLVLYKRKQEIAMREAEQYRLRRQRDQQLKQQEIRKRIQSIEIRKRQRQEAIKRGVVFKQKQKSPPLYKEKQKEYAEQIQRQEEKVRDIIRKRKQQMALRAQEIKAHEKAFINQLKARFSKNSPDNGKEKKKQRHKSVFNLFVQHDTEQKKLDLQKYKRRKRFEDKLRKVPINIDEGKRKQALIERDKAQNPLKYNYLLSMGLSEDKIYDQFKEFEININKYELGNNYMRKVHNNISSQSRLKASKSTPVIQPIKPQYKNYLPEVKVVKKKKKKSVLQTEVDEVLEKYHSQNERKIEFSKKYSSYQNQVISKIKQLKSIGGYSQSLNHESQIDDLYMKSIKLKIASAHIS